MTGELQELLDAARQMVEAYEPSHSNEWMYEDGWGKSYRRDWKKDDAARKRLADAIAKVKRIVG